MANTSILAAFERMWQHVVALVGDATANADEVYVGETEPTNENIQVWVNTAEDGDVEEPIVYIQDTEPGNAITGSLWVDTDASPVEIEEFETWTFTLDDGTTVTKNVKVGI